MPFFYNAADALVFASLHEGFGIPILEAMACGCPVITSNKSSMPEVAGDAALFVDPLDVDAIANAMRTIVENDLLKKDFLVWYSKSKKAIQLNKERLKEIKEYLISE